MYLHRLGAAGEDKNLIVSHLQFGDILGGDHFRPGNAFLYGPFLSNRDIDFIPFFLKSILGVDVPA